jgi:AAA ATPase domain
MAGGARSRLCWPPSSRVVASGRPELVLVSGYSGIGKSSVVNELHKVLVPTRGLFASGKFDQLVFQRFIGVFARPEHPLALFLDDLQWLDAATLDLLQDLLTRPDVRHLVLIGAYRDNEVNSAHPLMRKLEAIRNSGAVVREIILAPLTEGDLRQLISDSLRCEAEPTASLAQLVHEKTAGNPFLAIQFISALAEEGLLTFDHSARTGYKDVVDHSFDLGRPGERPVELSVYRGARFSSGGARDCESLSDPSQLGHSFDSIGKNRQAIGRSRGAKPARRRDP